VKRLGIVGAGDLGAQIAHLARKTGAYEPVAFYDDQRPPGTSVCGIQVLGGLAALDAAEARAGFDELAIAIGYRHLAFRHQLFERLRGRYRFATLLDPDAMVDSTATIGEGAVVYAGCVVDLNARIGCNTLLNVGCVIAHDSHVGDGCFLSPAVKLAGFVAVGPLVQLGIGTIVIDNVRISTGVRTGAGAVVIGDLDMPGLYVGLPATRKKA
jgi:sugar O-acyltransferase (sialic acid O-acetyltransferase NeuD family)